MLCEDNAAGTEMPAADAAVRHIHHHSYACWDAEETRHFYEDILGMPLAATAVRSDPLRTDGSLYCQMLFKAADGSMLAFHEHTSLQHPREATARRGLHRTLTLAVEGNAMVRHFKRRLDAAGVTNALVDHGSCLSLRCNDPNDLMLELTAHVAAPRECPGTSAASAHMNLRQWLYYRQNWWRSAAGMK
jgi:glyoxylase I family protein